MKFVSTLAVMILASTALATTADAVQLVPRGAKPVLRICGGKDGGMYDRAANYMDKYLKDVADVVVLKTKGSMDNIDGIVNDVCDAAFTQRDALIVAGQKSGEVLAALDVAGNLIAESAHLVCNKEAGISKMWQLTKDHTVAVGDMGGGSWVSWQALALKSPKTYKPIGTDTRSGLRALKAVESGEVTCAWNIVGEGASLYTSFDGQALGDKIQLVRTDDTDLKAVKDLKGKPFYDFGSLSGKIYQRLAPSGVFSYDDVGVMKIQSVMVVKTDWIAGNEAAYERVLQALTRARRDIEAELAARK